MIQLNNLNQVFLKRTLRPTYALTQATPQSGNLDPNWTRAVPIWPGMALQRAAGTSYPENAQSYASGDIITPVSQSQTGFPTGAQPSFTLLGGTTGGTQGAPVGLCAQYIGGDGIDELQSSGVNAVTCWVLGPDAQMEVDAPAFDAVNGGTWTDPGASEVFVYARIGNMTGAVGLNGQSGTATTGLQGQLILSTGVVTGTAVSTYPVARLVSVNSSTSITIAGLNSRTS